MPSFDADSSATESTHRAAHIPAHKDFREKYFQGFKKDSDGEWQFDFQSDDSMVESSGVV